LRCAEASSAPRALAPTELYDRTKELLTQDEVEKIRLQSRDCRADFDAPGRLDMRAIEELGVPREGDFYLCGPPAVMNDLTVELGAWGVIINRIHTEIFGSSPSKTAGHRRGTAPVSVRFVPDSPLEEGVTSEPVSEIGLFRTILDDNKLVLAL
jgi:ferredoxin-NADP reductase